MPTRGIRGAITVPEDHPEAIVEATQELLQAILAANPNLQAADIASAIFTVTDDISTAFPARAAHDMGWDRVPLLCAREIPVPESLPGCIRILIHWNTDLSQSQIQHVYLKDAVSLRPDLTVSSSKDEKNNSLF
jgi:chorismate mutase